MPKVFNVTAVCIPEKHYMVNMEERLKAIKVLVDGENYFIINQARQYGKTTTLRALEKYLKKDYYIISMDFQTFSSAEFKDENTFSLSFADLFVDLLKRTSINISEELGKVINELQLQINSRNNFFTLNVLFRKLSDFCTYSDKPIVLMIDEIDSAVDNQVFLDFLSQLRAYYIKRDIQPTFQSVILAGVYDVKNLKRKFCLEKEYKMNSPWNIAADFKIDMSFSKYEIAGMIDEYEKDYHTGMNIDKMACLLYDYTSGYPFLVSRLCKLLDEDVSITNGSKSAAWTEDGFYEAVQLILTEKNALFDSLVEKLISYPELNVMIESLLFTRKNISYNSDEPAIDIAAMFGFIKKQDHMVMIANRIFETRFYNRYLSVAELCGEEYSSFEEKQLMR